MLFFTITLFSLSSRKNACCAPETLGITRHALIPKTFPPKYAVRKDRKNDTVGASRSARSGILSHS